MVYHVFNRSIAKFTVFNDDHDFLRMLELLSYYRMEKPVMSFSRFSQLKKSGGNGYADMSILPADKEGLIELTAYCIMPTHFHLILKEQKDHGISKFINNILNSYSRYFNLSHGRKGPLWESRSQRVAVASDEQLMHLTRYIHLNPVTAYIVDRPEDWAYSSYNEYIPTPDKITKICKYEDLLHINPDVYKKFVEDRISYQRDLAKIKDLLLE